MKRLLICAGVLAVFLVTPLVGAEPNRPGLEKRIAMLEARIEQLEARIEQLENGGGTAEEETAEDEAEKTDKEKARAERAKKTIEDANDNIIITKRKIKDLPSTADKPPEEKLDIVEDRRQLLMEMQRNLSKIINLAKINPELGVDIEAVEKELVECEREKEKADTEKDQLEERISNERKAASERRRQNLSDKREQIRYRPKRRKRETVVP